MQTDSTYIQQIVTSRDYGYLQEIDGASVKTSTDFGSGSGMFTEVPGQVDNAASKLLDVMHSLSRPVGFLVVVAIVGALLWQLKRRLTVDIGDDEPQGMGHDTIYHHDWLSEIRDRYTGGRYSEVVVLAYLYKLSALDSVGVIKFAGHKTPGMFEREVAAHPDTTRAQRESVRWLTNHYLRVRYGHKEAGAPLALEALDKAGVRLDGQDADTTDTADASGAIDQNQTAP